MDAAVVTPRARATSKDEILDAAERIFALKGFDGAAMREIAEAAGVAQALLHYHFGTKDALFEAMFLRRSGEINRIRLAKLEAMERAEEPPTLRELLDALIRPTIEAGHTAARVGHSFTRLILNLGASPEEHHKAMIATSYDPMAKRYIAALRRALPGLSEADATWGYLFIIGAALSMMTPTGRVDRLSHGAATDSDTQALLERVIAFAAAGLEAYAARSP